MIFLTLFLTHVFQTIIQKYPLFNIIQGHNSYKNLRKEFFKTYLSIIEINLICKFIYNRIRNKRGRTLKRPFYPLLML
jgi:hypothetical protein